MPAVNVAVCPLQIAEGFTVIVPAALTVIVPVADEVQVQFAPVTI